MSEDISSKKPFDGSASLAKGLVSMGFLITVFLFFMGYRFYEIQTVFIKWLPIGGSPEDPDRLIAATLLAIGTVFSTLVFMVHSKKLVPWTYPKGDKKGEVGYIYWSNVVLVMISFGINYVFWEAWQPGSVEGVPTHISIRFKWFTCIMISAFDYGFAHLFDVLRNESTINQSIEELKGKSIRLKEDVVEWDTKLKALRREENKIKQFINKSTCTKCGKVCASPEGMNSHKCKPKQ